MPSFSRETIEAWRAERVCETSVEDGLNAWQQDMLRETIDEDIRVENARLAAAKAQVIESNLNLRRLSKKSRGLRESYGK